MGGKSAFTALSVQDKSGPCELYHINKQDPALKAKIVILKHLCLKLSLAPKQITLTKV